MLHYERFPPVGQLETILKHAPECAYIFIKIWNERDVDDIVIVDKSAVQNVFSITPTLLRNNCRRLENEKLLKLNETPDFFKIQLHF